MLDLAKKELTERAARSSTYLGAGTKHGTPCRHVANCRSTVALFGDGVKLFYNLAWAQWAAILLFVPLSMAGMIAAERERGSWDLLQRTDLRPWEIIAQKFTAGMVIQLTSILLLAPLGAMALSAGGLVSCGVWRMTLALALVAVLIGAVSMLCSTLTINATTATLSVYAVTASFLLLPNLSPSAGLQQLQSGQRSLFLPLMMQLGASLAMLLLANYWLLRPPFEWDGRLAAFLKWITRRKHDSRLDNPLLAKSPVAWRELKRHSLDRWQRLLCYALPFIAIVGEVAWGVVSLPNWQPRVVMPMLDYGLWIGSFLILALVSANMVVRERSQQTLAILLTTPIQSAELMKQKARALRHIALGCALVSGSCAISSVFVSQDLNPSIYLFTVMLELLFYLPLVYWLGMIIGAGSSNWRRAVIFVFLMLTAIIVMPFLALYLPVFAFFAMLSPTGFIVANELQTGISLFNYLMEIVHFGLIAFVVLGLRHFTVWFASSWLGRTVGSAWVNPEQEPVQNQFEDPY